MFVVVEMTDSIRVEPWLFNVDLEQVATVELNRKLSNKVVCGVGLCICLFDILKLNDSYIFPGDGASHTKVHFRYVVFKPFIDEILVGRIKSCNSEGIHVTLGFFDDIIIAPEALQQSSKFDEAEQVWVWLYETDDGNHDLFMDVNEEIRFRVVDECFTDTNPDKPPAIITDQPVEKELKAPYTIKGSICESGLGLLSWWNS